ncbi:MAG TPA: hypothetical protein VEX65_05385 [Flavisolibacter sp.]|nr:hypothetical protein [Flavisolibacter sp.]
MQKVISLFILFLFISRAVFGQNKSIQNFIPAGYILLDSASGDLNRDSYRDLVLVLKKNGEEDSVDVPRPLLLLQGSATGYSLAGRNDNVVLCYSCGGVFGDPYQGITIKNGYFSLEHYGGSSWRWTRIITFRYDAKGKQFRLHRDAGASFHTAEPDNQEQVLYHPERFGKTWFTQYVSD